MKHLLSLFIIFLIPISPLMADHECQDVRERLKWIDINALKAAIDDIHHVSDSEYTQLTGELAFIQTHLEQVKQGMKGADSLLYLPQAYELLDKQKAIVMSNPLLDMDRILVTRFTLGARARKAMAPSMCMPAGNYMGLMDIPKRGYQAEICILSQLRNNETASRTLYKPAHGEGIADVQLHWNGDRMLFTSAARVMLPGDKPFDAWHIFEMNTDGSELHQVTTADDPDLEFADPCYLPNGKILLTTNIGYNGIPCEHGLRAIHNLALYDPASNSMRKISFDQDGNWSPTVLHNGRIMYTRWEYTDLTHYFSRIVMHANPDGTETKALYGSNSYWPNSIYDMQQLPGKDNRFIGIVTGHHGVSRSGRLFIFDPSKGRHEEEGVVQELPYRGKQTIPEIKDYLVDGVWPQFTRPYPLSDKYFLVSAKLHKQGLWGIYLVDVFNNLTLIAEQEGEGYITPIPMVKRPIPPVIPEKIKPGDKEATVFIQDIYEGEGLKGVPVGTVKKLRIFTYEYAYLNSPSDFDAQGIQSGWDIKRELGTVEVESDGSVLFKVPANTPISIQPLDEKGRAIQWMRSWFTPMPGEIVSCVGCHEDQNSLPLPKRPKASQMTPRSLTPPKGGIRPFTFQYEIQPILDRYCISCHDGQHHSLYLKGDSSELYKRGVITKLRRYYTKSYLNLHPYVYRQGPEADIHILRPYEYHASNSELIRMLEKGHHGVQLADTDLRTLYQWIDFNVPYSGSFEIWKPYKGFEQYERRRELMRKYGHTDVDWKAELKAYADTLRARGEVQPVMPVPQKKRHTARHTDQWAFDAATARQMQSQSSPLTERTIEIAPGVSMLFRWIPAGSFVKGEDRGDRQPTEHHTVKIKRGFWMGTLEVSNAQYQALVPGHDSRFIGQQWKDHTTPGYPVNRPEQPVVRVSWEEAMEYCRLLSRQTGLHITLPTEEQWEWACRAGSAKEMWYGGCDDEYSHYENLADSRISQLAVMGVNPKPMPANYELRKFWDFVPRDRFSDDGALVSVAGGRYQPNPWGLHDMHGNVAEWVDSGRSDGKGSSMEKIVCGGSWRDRACTSTASYRRYYLPWQAPFNVGFRVIICEE